MNSPLSMPCTNPQGKFATVWGSKLSSFQLKFMRCRIIVTKENASLIGKNFVCPFSSLYMDDCSLGLISNHKSCSQLNVEHSHLVMWHFRCLWCWPPGPDPESRIGGVSELPILLSAHVAFPLHSTFVSTPRLLWLIMLCFGHLIATWLWMWLLLWLMSTLW